MPALVAGIYVFLAALSEQDVDGRDEPGHDSREMVQYDWNTLQEGGSLVSDTAPMRHFLA